MNPVSVPVLFFQILHIVHFFAFRNVIYGFLQSFFFSFYGNCWWKINFNYHQILFTFSYSSVVEIRESIVFRSYFQSSFVRITQFEVHWIGKSCFYLLVCIYSQQTSKTNNNRLLTSFVLSLYCMKMLLETLVSRSGKYFVLKDTQKNSST